MLRLHSFFFLSRAMTGEKKKNPQDELVIAFFYISRAPFHSPVRRNVAIRMQVDPSCPSGIAMLNRAMYGTKDAAQCFDSYSERTMEKLDYNIRVFNPCLYKHPVKGVSVLRHGDDFATLATRTRIAEFKEDLSKHLLGTVDQKFSFANKQQRREHTRRASQRQFTHSQTSTTRCHVIPFQCHGIAVCQ